MNFSQKCAIALVHSYQALRPALNSIQKTAFGHVPQCRYEQTCSEYMVANIKRYGTMRGIVRGLLRIFHCWGLLRK